MFRFCLTPAAPDRLRRGSARAEKQPWRWFAFHHEPNLRQTTISDIENGNVEVSTGTLALLAAALDKPLNYFFPRFLHTRLKPENLSPLDEKLIIFFRQLSNDEV
jgi:hypothetical protein